MKKKFLLLTLLASFMVGCNNSTPKSNINFDDLESNDYQRETEQGDLGEFNLLTPNNGESVTENPVFTWENSVNATSYTLEICESNTFVSGIESVAYYIQRNISGTSFSIQSELTAKNITYYWRVTAYNDKNHLECKDVKTFFYAVEETDEVEFEIGDAFDWTLHSLGSKADISVDNSNFFGNNKPSLVVCFKEEDTNRGIPESDGWLIATRTIEKSTYGTDAIFFNFYYAGNDANFLIRFVDKDNEYWYYQIHLSNNAKQTVIVKFSEFIQRTRDVPVSNQEFDYSRIKYMEIVFEKAFGDGVALINDVKAIKYSNYQDRFIDTLHFGNFTDADFTDEACTFIKDLNEDEMTINFFGKSTAPEGITPINGYGFAKLNVNRYFGTGDAVKVSIKYSGSKGNNVILRIYEEDTDRWAYKIPYSTVSTEEYTTFVIPFKAFDKSQIDGGDGKRQFYYIYNIQFGLDNNYGAGSISFKDFQIVSSDDYDEEEYRVVNEDGIIESFDTYRSTSEMYFIWDVSDVNKDEYIALNTTDKLGGESNKACASLYYKSDMEAARYTLPVSVASSSANAIKMDLKDVSSKSSLGKHVYLGDVSAKVIIAITLITGEIYNYVIEELNKAWYEYVIPFEAFSLTNEDDLPGTTKSLTAIGMKSLTIALQYFYYDQQGNPSPAYTNTNYILADNIKLTNSDTVKVNPKENIIDIPSGDTKGYIDNFERYESTQELQEYWGFGRDYDYQSITLDNDVSSSGGSKSVKLGYQVNSDSVSYYTTFKVSDTALPKGMVIDIKGDGQVTIYINLYARIGTSDVQFRATLTSVSNSWNRYTLGFDNFSNVSGSSVTLNKNNAYSIYKITFGAVCWDGNQGKVNSFFNIDNVAFDNSLSYSVNNITPLD